MRNLINTFTVLFLGFVTVGCYDNHRTVGVSYEDDFFTAPMLTPDAGPSIGGDAGWTMPVPDSGTIVTADAGSDAFVPPTEDAGSDAGSDAGPPPEPDSGPVDTDAGPAPDFVIEAFDMRPSAILVAGDANWQQVASYRVGYNETLVAAEVYLLGDAADITQVAVVAQPAEGGVEPEILGTGVFPSGVDTNVRIVFDAPHVTPIDTLERINIWVRVPSVVFGASVSGATVGVTRSGDTFRVGLGCLERYIGFGSWRALFGPIMSNEFVIRQSRPMFIRQALSTTSIANGTNQDLYKFQVSADSAGSIELTRIGMSMEINSTAGRVCNLRIRRGSTEMSPADYSISGPMFMGAERCWTAGSLPLIMRFVQTISGSGYVYTVFGTPEGFVSGDTITTSFNTSDDRILTGYLRSVWASTSTDLALDLSPYGAPLSTSDVRLGHLIWSDLSEVPHSSMHGSDGGSRDWTNGYLIENLTQIQTLVR